MRRAAGVAAAANENRHSWSNGAPSPPANPPPALSANETAEETTATSAALRSGVRGGSYRQEAPAWLINSKQSQLLELEVRKVGGGLGLIPSEVPHKLLQKSSQKAKLYVSNLTAGSGAASSGLQLYDRLLEINDASLRNMTKLEANRAFSKIPEGGVCKLLVARDASDAAELEALTRKSAGGSGSSAAGGASGDPKVPDGKISAAQMSQIRVSSESSEYREQLTGLLSLQNRHLPKPFMLSLPDTSTDYRGLIRITFRAPDDSVGYTDLETSSATTTAAVIGAAAARIGGVTSSVVAMLQAGANYCELVEIDDRGGEYVLELHSEPLKRVVKSWQLQLIRLALEAEPTAEAGFVLRAKRGSKLEADLAAESKKKGKKKKKGWFGKKK